MAYFRNGSVPEDRLSIYKTLDDVPSDRRLGYVVREQTNIGYWEAFIEDRREESEGLSDSRMRSYNRCERSWKQYMESEGRHYAFADPEHVEGWCEWLLEDRTMGTVYNDYFSILYLFYAFLWYHTDTRHSYNPVLMAAAEGGKTRELWMFKVSL